MVFVAKIILLLLTMTNLVLAQTNRSKLPVLRTKQALNNLRFVSQDGKFTYYQRRSGALLLSANYQVSEVLAGTIGTQYTLSATPLRKRILISQNLNYHDYLSVRHSQKIYVVSYGSDAPQFVGEGLYPTLHLEDEWVSYFDAKTRKLHFRHLSNQALKFEIKLNNTRNPYFVPQVVMLSDSTVVYTDLNQLGFTGLLVYNRTSDKAELITKTNQVDQKLEFCLNSDYFYKLTSGLNDSSFGTQIHRSPREGFLKNEPTLVYQSKQNDLGHLECHVKNDRLYFIKNTSEEQDNETYEVAELLLKDNQVKVLSDLNYATQMINLDGRLLVPYRGDYYVIIGDSDLTEEDRLTPQTPPPLPPKSSENKGAQ